MNNNFFESKKFSIVLGALLLVLLAISGFALLGDADNSTKKISTTLEQIGDDFEENAPFKKEEEPLDPNYEEEISKQYEDYNKVKEEANKKKPTNTTGKTTPAKPSTSNGGKGSSGGGNYTTPAPSGNNGGSNGGTNGGSKPSNDIPKVELPPINVGDANPTVPKEPNKPKPTPEPPKDEPTNPPKDDEGTPPKDGDNTTPPDNGGTTPPPDNGGTTPPDDGGTTPPDTGGDTGGDTGTTEDDLSSINPVSRPAPIDTGSHETLSDSQLSGKTGLSMTGTTYWDGFRLQPIKVERTSYGIAVEIEIANMSDKPLTVDETNFKWLYEIQPGVNSPTSILGAPVTIQPNSTSVINVSTPYSDAEILQVKLRGLDSIYNFTKVETQIKDSTALDGSDMFEVNGKKAVEALHVGHMVGTTNFKVEPLGVVLSGDTKLGPLSKTATGSLGVVKVRFANTSSKEISLEKIQVSSVNYNTEKWHTVDYALKDLSLIGPNAFPTKIPAKTIVEGYLPFFSDDPNFATLVYVETSAEEFYISNVETYSPFALMQ